MEAEIGETRAALIRSLQRGDAAMAACVYADDARLLPPTADPVRGRPEIEAYWRAGIALGLSGVDFDRQVLACVAGMVVEIGRYVVTIIDDRAGQLVDRGTYLVLHRQVADGSWRRSVDVFDSDEPSAARHDEGEM